MEFRRRDSSIYQIERMNTMKRVLSLLLSVVMLLGVMTSCQGNNAGDSSNTYRYLYSGEVTTLNYLVTDVYKRQFKRRVRGL